MSEKAHKVAALRSLQIQQQREPLPERKRADLNPQSFQEQLLLDSRDVTRLGIRYTFVDARSFLGAVVDQPCLLHAADVTQESDQVVKFERTAKIVERLGQQCVGIRRQLLSCMIDQVSIFVEPSKVVLSDRRTLLGTPFGEPAKPSLAGLPQCERRAVHQDVPQLALETVPLGILLSQVSAAGVERGNGHIAREVGWRFLAGAQFERSDASQALQDDFVA